MRNQATVPASRSSYFRASAWCLSVSVALLALLLGRAAAAEEPPAAELAATKYAEGGVGVCVECHDETEKHPVYSIFKTKHATLADSRSPLASTHACQACHGASAEHVEDDDVAVGVSFSSTTPVDKQNDVCLSCHSGAARTNWQFSRHASREVACVSCHDIHTDEDPVLREDIRPGSWTRPGTQSEVCFTCHMEQRSQVQRVSAHPIRDGKMRCSDCHNPHGSAGPRQLNKLTVNETCFQCHAEKRGPFVWEHGPVREDCSICHTPHGSNYPSLLKARGPYLCQQCHMAPQHPSTAYSGTGIPANAGAAQQLLVRNCLNCHIEVHGSNHPSGVRWTR